ncbi:MAG TPA: hypothetical protein VG672_29320 [Bryobacteraceae bacterium]|jgi:hypothetical protein|nr:hypothetical protein [Bryobacteraceae bacterium]
MDFHQLWTILSTPDNVPIVLLLFVVPFYTWYGLRQSLANDRLIAQLEADPALAKTHHRKTQPYQPGWAKEVHVWPYLLRIEFLAAIILTIILLVWSITLNAPLEEPANPTLTMNPAKAPWYFLGLQEMLVYFDPWIAGVVMPSLIIVGLMVIPYIDANPLGSGYYTFRQRKFAIWTFIVGFIVLWVSMIVIGTLIRGPGWMWFWPGTTWDHNRLIFEVNRDLPDLFGIKGRVGKILFGAVVVGIYFVAAWVGLHKLIAGDEVKAGGKVLLKARPFNRKIYARMSLLQYAVMQVFLILMLALPVKMLLRHLFRIKYVWVTPWFNV